MYYLKLYDDDLLSFDMENDLGLKISNIKILLSSKITKINGDDALSSVIINDKDTLKADGMFISIGLEPCNDIFKGLINLTDDGYIKTDDCKTIVSERFITF